MDGVVGGGLTGTRDGKCVMWHFRGEYCKDSTTSGADNDGTRNNQQNESSSTSPQDWEPLAPTEVGGRVRLLAWGYGKGELAACNETTAFLLDETLMQRTLNDGVAAIQTSSDTVKVSGLLLWPSRSLHAHEVMWTSCWCIWSD